MSEHLFTDDPVKRVARSLMAAWYRLPNCPGELYDSEATALAKAALEAMNEAPSAIGPSGGTLAEPEAEAEKGSDL